MKKKIVLTILLIFLMIISIPNINLAYSNSDVGITYNDNSYQVYKEGTATLLELQQQYNIKIHGLVNYLNEDYTLTKIDANALKALANNSQLFLEATTAPTLENASDYSFENISNIYVLPNSTGYTSTNGWPEEKIKTYIEHELCCYELLDNNTARIVRIERDNNDVKLYGSVESNGKTYKVTSISSHALDGTIGNVALSMEMENVPVLDDANYTNFFSKVEKIGVAVNATGYTAANGWPEEKVRTFYFTVEPQDLTITAGNVKETDRVIMQGNCEVLTGEYLNDMVDFKWYFCDENGNITDNNPFYENTSTMTTLDRENILNDLQYNHENNTAKDYYCICVIGKEGGVTQNSKVVKITVNPGTYKVDFMLDGENSIQVSVNGERKLNQNDIPTLEQLKDYKLGEKLVGWYDESDNLIDLSTAVFNKNTQLKPVWETKVKLDANGGKFDDGTTVKELTIRNSDMSIIAEELINIDTDKLTVSREGYKFVNVSDAKSAGTTIYEYLMNPDFVLDEEKTFYVQWKSLTGEDDDNPNVPGDGGNLGEDDNQNPSGDNDQDKNENKNENADNNSNSQSGSGNNPQTGDHILVFIVMLLISVFGLIFIKKRK